MKQAILYVFVLLSMLGFHGQAQGVDEKLSQLNAQAVQAYHAGKYQEGIAIAEKAFQYALKEFGKEHPDTLTSMNNLGALYKSQVLHVFHDPLLRHLALLPGQPQPCRGPAPHPAVFHQPPGKGVS